MFSRNFLLVLHDPVMHCISLSTQLSPVPSAKAFQLKDLHFDDFQLRDDQMLSAAIRMFTDFEFLKTYRIENQVSWQKILSAFAFQLILCREQILAEDYGNCSFFFRDVSFHIFKIVRSVDDCKP